MEDLHCNTPAVLLLLLVVVVVVVVVVVEVVEEIKIWSWAPKGGRHQDRPAE
jgi:hypothetical protein